MEDKIKKAKELGAIKSASHGDLVVFFREPSRMALGIAMAEIDRDVVKACEIIYYDACIAEVSDLEAYAKDTALFMGIIPLLQSLVSVKKSLYTTL